MRISHSTINRICEEKAAADPAVRDEFRQKGRGFLSDGRALSDEELIAKLGAFGYAIDRASFAERATGVYSAQDLATEFLNQFPDDHWGTDEDWVWIALTCLWERWLPDRPSMEMIDDWMQAGYKKLEARETAAACRVWLRAWHSIWRIMQELRLRTIDEFDELFAGTQSLFNWVQDFVLDLYNAGLNDPSFFRERITVVNALLNHVDLPDSLWQNFRSDLAESYFGLGEPVQGEQLYRDWLTKEPRWGFGWMGWSDCHSFWPPKESRDYAKAEAILRQGLAVPDVKDREVLLERLADLCEETGRAREGEAFRKEASRLRNPPLKPTAAGLASLLGNRPRTVSEKAGRNDPCPCGSGKKFKRCCAKRGGA